MQSTCMQCKLMHYPARHLCMQAHPLTNRILCLPVSSCDTFVLHILCILSLACCQLTVTVAGVGCGLLPVPMLAQVILFHSHIKCLMYTCRCAVDVFCASAWLPPERFSKQLFQATLTIGCQGGHVGLPGASDAQPWALPRICCGRVRGNCKGMPLQVSRCGNLKHFPEPSKWQSQGYASPGTPEF